MFLTQEEIKQLTGYKNPSAQMRWLQREGFYFRVAADGRPRVLKQFVINTLGGHFTETQGSRRAGPYFEKI
jgi:hypothetical protein